MSEGGGQEIRLPATKINFPGQKSRNWSDRSSAVLLLGRNSFPHISGFNEVLVQRGAESRDTDGKKQPVSTKWRQRWMDRHAARSPAFPACALSCLAKQISPPCAPRRLPPCFSSAAMFQRLQIGNNANTWHLRNHSDSSAAQKSCESGTGRGGGAPCQVLYWLQKPPLTHTNTYTCTHTILVTFRDIRYGSGPSPPLTPPLP